MGVCSSCTVELVNDVYSTMLYINLTKIIIRLVIVITLCMET